MEGAIADSKVQLTRDPLPSVQAQSGRVTPLLQNLLGNAIKFRGEKPAAVQVGARQEGDEGILSVADQGIGIVPKYFNRIFVQAPAFPRRICGHRHRPELVQKDCGAPWWAHLGGIKSQGKGRGFSLRCQPELLRNNSQARFASPLK